MSEVRPFISYAREDASVAEQLYEDIRQHGGTPWLDVRCLVPGQDWAKAVRDAVRASSHFVAIISAQSVNKRGFLQKELRQALEILAEFPPDTTFVIPVRIDQSIPAHEDLRRLHWLNLFPSYQRALPILLKSLGLSIQSCKSPDSVTSLHAHIDDARREAIEKVVNEGGTVEEQATRLGVSRVTLSRLLHRYRIL